MVVSPRSIVFAPLHNHKRKDAENVFQPEARRFTKRHGLNVQLNMVLIDNSRPRAFRRMEKQILDAMGHDMPKWKTHLPVIVAFVNHGHKNRIQFGFPLKRIDKLAKAIRRRGGDNVRVVLYCCDTGRDLDKDRKDDRYDEIGGDGGWADMLRDALCRAGAVDCIVFAHSDKGHAGRLPFVRLFEGKGSKIGGMGGSLIVAPGSALWKRWIKALKTPLRFDYPLMTVAEIHARLARIRA